MVLDPVPHHADEEPQDLRVEIETSEVSNNHPSLPVPVQGISKKKTGNFRNKSLVALHNQMVGLEVRFQRDVFELEGIYTEKYYKPLQELRRKLLEYNCVAPTYSLEYWNELVDLGSAAFPPNSRSFNRLKENVNNMLLYLDTNTENYDSYWLKVLLNSAPIVSDLICSKDFEKLKYVSEIKSSPLEVFRKSEDDLCDTAASGIGFEIRFEFRQNPFFTNHSLYKRYVVDTLPAAADYIQTHFPCNEPNKQGVNACDADGEASGNEMDLQACTKNTELLLDYKGPRVVSIKGCSIKWINTGCESSCATDSDVTEASFFDYFTTEWDNNIGDNDCTTSQVLRDYEIGTYFRDVLIPRSYAFYRQINQTCPKIEKNLPETSTNETSFYSAVEVASMQTKTLHQSNTSSYNTSSGKTEYVTAYQSSDMEHLKPTQGGNKELDQNYCHNPQGGNKELDQNYCQNPQGGNIELDRNYCHNPQGGNIELDQNQNYDLKRNDENKFIKESPKISARQRRSKPSFKISYSTNVDENYDQVDDEIVLRRTKIPVPSMRCDIDDSVEIPRHHLPVSMGVNNRFDRQLECQPRYFDAFAPTCDSPGPNPCCKEVGRFQSTEQRRKEMSCVVDSVNKLLKYADKKEFPNVSVDDVLQQDAKERAIKLCHMNRNHDGSEVGFSDGVHSMKGDDADDEDAWSDIQPPSVNRAFERIKYEMKTSNNCRKRKCCQVADDSTDSLISSKPSCGENACGKRIRYRDVSAYPIVENPCDESDDVISSKDGDSPCMSDVCCERERLANLPTPNTTDSEDSDHTRKVLDKIEKKNAVVEAPLVSAGVEARARDTDSEAPPTPKEGEIPNCKQQ